MSQRPRSTFVVTDHSEVVRALVGLKDVQVLAYTRNGDVQLLIEQVVGQVRCPACSEVAQSKNVRSSTTSTCSSMAPRCRSRERSTGCEEAVGWH